jgi:hypothetical protein
MYRAGIAFFVFSLVIFSSCKKDGPIEAGILAAKPISAIVDGARIFYYAETVSFIGDVFSFYAIDTINKGSQCEGYEIISISFKAKTTGNSIQLSNNGATSVSSGGYCSMIGFWYTTDSIHKGYVNLTELDTINHIASGTFSFTAEMQSPVRYGGIDTVTNGAFVNLK